MSDSKVLIGGERMVQLRGSVLIPADLEIIAPAGENYRRVSGFLATQVEHGRAPWMVKRDSQHRA